MSRIAPDFVSAHELYHENSKLHHSDRTLARWIGYINSDPALRRMIATPARPYLHHPLVALPRENASGELAEVALSRRSALSMSSQPMTAATLGSFLNLAAGETYERADDDGTVWRLRACPSGGAVYPLDLYVTVHTVEDVTAGLYYFDPLEHGLRLLREGDLRPELNTGMYLEAVHASSACFLIAATFARTTFKYGERGYRFALLEAGHIAQNLLLAATAAGLASVPVGGFVDDDLNALIGVDGVSNAVLYTVLVGGRA